MLGVLDAADESIDARVAIATIDDDGANNAAGRLQQVLATVLQVKQNLYGRQVVGILLQIEEFRQLKVLRQSNVIELCVFH